MALSDGRRERKVSAFRAASLWRRLARHDC